MPLPLPETLTAGTAGHISHHVDLHTRVNDLDAGMPLNAKDYGVVADGVTNDAPALAAMIAAGEANGRGVFQLPPGRVFINSPVYLNSTIREQSYVFQGMGRGTVLALGSGLNGAYAFYSNQTSGGVKVISFPRPGRVVFRDLAVDGDATLVAQRSLIWYNETAPRFFNVRVRYLYRGLSGVGYTDGVVIDGLHIEQPVSGGAFYKQGADLGDGLTIRSVSAPADAVVADLTQTAGGVISACIGGRYVLLRCDGIQVVGHHTDTDSALLPAFEISHSRVTFDRTWDHVDTAPLVQITDTGPGNQSNSDITFHGCSFGFRHDAATKRRSAHIHIAQAQTGTRLRWRGCLGQTWPSGSTHRHHAGFKVTSVDAAIQAVIDAAPHQVLGDADLRYIDGSWHLTAPPPVQRLSSANKVAEPTLAVSATTTALGQIPNATTYFYRVAARRGEVDTAAASEASVTTTAVNQSVSLNVTAGIAPATIRIWRGTATTVYTAYVDVPIGDQKVFLFDTGDNVAGYGWVTTGIPALPSSSQIDMIVLGNHRLGWGAAAPTTGTWARGDIVYSTLAAAAGKAGWVCITAGTPGTWKPFAAIDA